MAVSVDEIVAAQDEDRFLRFGFEVYISNSKNNDLQNITGTAVDSNGNAEEAFAGGLYKTDERTYNEGYTEAELLNANSHYMTLADNGFVDGLPAEHTGIYACNTYDVNKITDGGALAINFPGKTLGLVTPAGHRTDYTELMVGESYKFAILNFSTDDVEKGDIVAVEDGLWDVVTSVSDIEAGHIYGVVTDIKNFTEGANHGAFGAIVKIFRSNANSLPPVTSADEGKFLRVNALGEWIAEEVPDAEGQSF